MIEDMGIMEYIRNVGTKQDTFVDSSQEGKMTISIMVVISCMTFATFLSFVLFWTYNQDPRLFSGILWSIVFTYAFGNLIYTVVSASKLSATSFKIFLSIHCIVSLMAAVLLIFYFVRGARAVHARKAASMSRGYSSGYTSPPMMSSPDE